MSKIVHGLRFSNGSISTPFLEIDIKKVIEGYNNLQKQLDGIEIFYAMKCNPNPQIMKTVLECGGNFEISSAYEMRAAMDIGADPKTILFSNPVKTRNDIREAYLSGVNCFAFDSYSEVDKLAECAPGAKVYVRLAAITRVKSAVASEGKFGVSIDQARDLIVYAKKCGLEPYGISFHVGSQMLDYEAWGYAIEHSAKLINILESDHIHLKFLDLGGGFPVCYENVERDNLDKIASCIAEALRKYIPNDVRVVAEPGRYLVAKSGIMVSTVIGVAERFERKWLHLDVGAINGLLESLETANTLAYPVYDSKQSKDKDLYVLTGPTCDSQDTIMYDVPISSNIEIGDNIFFEYAGAYTTACAENFNGFPSPSTYILDNREGLTCLLSDEISYGKKQNNDSVKTLIHGSECSIIDFDKYVNFCNCNNDGSRRRGILSEEFYEDIVHDDRTSFIISRNAHIPAIMDVSHGLAMGYDVVRCEEYAKDSDSTVKYYPYLFRSLQMTKRINLLIA